MLVTKGRSVPEILEVLKTYQADCIGESRWQEAESKLSHLPANLPKHFIGHLQSNKVKQIVSNFNSIDSVDSIKLAECISAEAVKQSKVLSIYLQVNISRDGSKFGFDIDELGNAIRQIKTLSGITLVGLMTITAKQFPNETRKDFAAMKKLQQQFQLPDLSMGMSNDWPIAVEEGATMIRLGTALFHAIV